MEEITIARERGDGIDVHWIYLAGTAEELVKDIGFSSAEEGLREKFVRAAESKRDMLMAISSTYCDQVTSLISSSPRTNRGAGFFSQLHTRVLKSFMNKARLSLTPPSSLFLETRPPATVVTVGQAHREEGKELITPVYTRDLREDSDDAQALSLFYSLSENDAQEMLSDVCGVVRPPDPLVDEPYIPDIDPCFQSITIVVQSQRKKTKKKERGLSSQAAAAAAATGGSLASLAQDLGCENEFVRPPHQVSAYPSTAMTTSLSGSGAVVPTQKEQLKGKNGSSKKKGGTKKKYNTKKKKHHTVSFIVFPR